MDKLKTKTQYNNVIKKYGEKPPDVLGIICIIFKNVNKISNEKSYISSNIIFERFFEDIFKNLPSAEVYKINESKIEILVTDMDLIEFEKYSKKVQKNILSVCDGISENDIIFLSFFYQSKSGIKCKQSDLIYTALLSELAMGRYIIYLQPQIDLKTRYVKCRVFNKKIKCIRARRIA